MESEKIYNLEQRDSIGVVMNFDLSNINYCYIARLSLNKMSTVIR